MPSILININIKLLYAFLVGSLGSAAYITALYFKFIGDSDDNRSIIFKPFYKRYTESVNLMKCIWYCCVGGFIAIVFQFDVPNFVAVQSLILGATWPAIVSQFLSGRMASPSKEEINKFLESRPEQSEKKEKISLEKRLSELRKTFLIK